MSSETAPSFDTKDRQRVYDYINEHGPVSPDELEDQELVSVTPERYWQIVAILKRDGYIVEEEGRLRDAYRPAGTEEHAAEDVEYTVRRARLEDLSGLAGVIRQVSAWASCSATLSPTRSSMAIPRSRRRTSSRWSTARSSGGRTWSSARKRSSGRWPT